MVSIYPPFAEYIEWINQALDRTKHGIQGLANHMELEVQIVKKEEQEKTAGYKKELEQVRRKYMEKDNELSDVKNQLSKSQGEVKSHTQTIEKLKKELASLRKQNEQNQYHIDQLIAKQKEWENLYEESKEKATQFAQLKKENEQLQFDLEYANRQIAMFEFTQEGQLSKLKNDYDGQIVQLKNRHLEEIRKIEADWQEKVSRIEEEKNRLLMQLSSR